MIGQEELQTTAQFKESLGWANEVPDKSCPVRQEFPRTSEPLPYSALTRRSWGKCGLMANPERQQVELLVNSTLNSKLS